MLGRSLRVGRIVLIGIVVVENTEVGAGFSPEVIGLGGMDVWIAAAFRGQNVVVGRGVGNLLADVQKLAVNEGRRGAIDKAVDEGGARVLEDGLNAAGHGCGLSPVVVFESDDEDVLDVAIVEIAIAIMIAILGARVPAAACNQ